MKKILMTALICIMTLGATTTAKAVVIVPGGIAGPLGWPHLGGAPVTTITQPIVYDNIAGSVTQTST